MRYLLLASLAAWIVACSEADPRISSDSAVLPPPPNPPPVVRTQLDLLLVIQSGGAVDEEQSSFANALPALLGPLLSGDAGPAGSGLPYESIHVGVVSADLGAGPYEVPSCVDPDGDDGALITRGNTGVAGCPAVVPPFRELTSESDPDALSSDLGCAVLLGNAGCGFEQPLEAALKAITTSTSAVTFVSGTGQADRANEGFLRPDAVLGVVVVAIEDDCSLADQELLDPESSRFSGGLNLRCHQYRDSSFGAVHAVSRYTDGLLAVVEGDASRLIFAAVVGIPPDAGDVDSAESAEAVMEHPLMEETLEPSDPNRLRLSCQVPGTGFAFPPDRIVSLAHDLATRGVEIRAHTVCAAELDGSMRSIAGALLSR